MSFFRMHKTSDDQFSLKTINYRGGVVTFRIPSHWKEEHSSVEGGVFFDGGSQSTLRLNVITATASDSVTADSGPEILRSVEIPDDAEVVSKGRNTCATFCKKTNESGIALRIYYWVIANPIPPKHARVATFSYTVSEHENESAANRRVLDLLAVEIPAAQFSPTIGR